MLKQGEPQKCTRGTKQSANTLVPFVLFCGYSRTDSFNESVRHAWTLSQTVHTCSRLNSGGGEEAFDFADDADDLFLVRKGDHEEFVALVEANHTVCK